MRWNWQQPDWPRFTWAASRLEKSEERFLLIGGQFIGTVRHLAEEDRDLLTVEAMSEEAVTTSRIEGEILDRESVQSSIRRQLIIKSQDCSDKTEVYRVHSFVQVVLNVTLSLLAMAWVMAILCSAAGCQSSVAVSGRDSVADRRHSDSFTSQRDVFLWLLDNSVHIHDWVMTS